MIGVDYASVDRNQEPNFGAAYDYGVRFAVVRAAYTFNGVQGDATVARDRVAASNAGLVFGAYLILGWSDDPIEQVLKFEEMYGDPGADDLPPSLDIEFPNGINATGLTPAAALAKVEAALTQLRLVYPTVMIYTSAGVWHDSDTGLGNPQSALSGSCPGWIKVSYPWAKKNPPHLDDVPAMVGDRVPLPWTAAGSPGVWIEQFQGDAVHVPGFTSTVDLNVFLPYVGNPGDPRTPWVTSRLADAGHPVSDGTSLLDAIRAFQTEKNLLPDGVIGVETWGSLCKTPVPATP